MHNWYAIETEAAARRRDWERAVEADARSAQAIASRSKRHLIQLPYVALTRLRSVTAPRFPFSTAMEPRCRTAACL